MRFDSIRFDSIYFSSPACVVEDGEVTTRHTSSVSFIFESNGIKDDGDLYCTSIFVNGTRVDRPECGFFTGLEARACARARECVRVNE